MRISLKASLFVAAVLAAGVTIMGVLVALPAPPAPTIKHFSSVYAVQLLPDVRVVRTDQVVPTPGVQTVERSRKGDRLSVAQKAPTLPFLLSPQLTAPAQGWLKPSGAPVLYNPPPVPFHCSAIIGCEII